MNAFSNIKQALELISRDTLKSIHVANQFLLSQLYPTFWKLGRKTNKGEQNKQLNDKKRHNGTCVFDADKTNGLFRQI